MVEGLCGGWGDWETVNMMIRERSEYDDLGGTFFLCAWSQGLIVLVNDNAHLLHKSDLLIIISCCHSKINVACLACHRRGAAAGRSH
jgi:hypothetical protein